MVRVITVVVFSEFNKTEKTFQSYAAGRTEYQSLHKIIQDNNIIDFTNMTDMTRKKMTKFYMFDFKDVGKKAVPRAAADYFRQLKRYP